jgi:hypothetical protein
MERESAAALGGRRENEASPEAEFAAGRCPVSGTACEDYRDCRNRTYCWLKVGEADGAGNLRT